MSSNSTPAAVSIPAARSDYPHFLVIPTRWMDNDVYGHVNNVVYYSWFDTAVNAWLIEQGALDIHAGEVIGLVGESGCGKSMTALSLLRLLPDGVVNAGGSVRLDGVEIEFDPQAPVLLLRNHGIYVQPINYPTVPIGSERLRFTPTPMHDDALMDHLIASVVAVFNQLGIARKAAA